MSADPKGDIVAGMSAVMGNRLCDTCRAFHTLSLYHYGLMNPLNNFDPLGLDDCDDDCDLWEGSGGEATGTGPGGGATCTKIDWQCTEPGKSDKTCTTSSCMLLATPFSGLIVGITKCVAWGGNPCSHSPGFGGSGGFGSGLAGAMSFFHQLKGTNTFCLTAGVGFGGWGGAMGATP